MLWICGAVVIWGIFAPVGSLPSASLVPHRLVPGTTSRKLVKMVQEVDQSGQHMEAVSPMINPSQSPPPRSVSAFSETIDNTPPMPVEYNQNA